jgi:hypothetical protein
MRAIQMASTRTGLAAGAVALMLAAGCSRVPAGSAVAAQPPAAQAGTPVVVGCEPHQRALVRPSIVNGLAVSQIECVAAAPVAEIQAPVQAQPVAYRPAAPARAVYAPVPAPIAQEGELPDARIVPAGTVDARPVPARQVIDERRDPVRKARSVKKSALIIGASAGAGAGAGAAIGGKKGALIGAALGGGGAAVWDQITRRR